MLNQSRSYDLRKQMILLMKVVKQKVEVETKETNKQKNFRRTPAIIQNIILCTNYYKSDQADRFLFILFIYLNYIPFTIVLGCNGSFQGDQKIWMDSMQTNFSWIVADLIWIESNVSVFTPKNIQVGNTTVKKEINPFCLNKVIKNSLLFNQ